MKIKKNLNNIIENFGSQVKNQVMDKVHGQIIFKVRVEDCCYVPNIVIFLVEREIQHQIWNTVMKKIAYQITEEIRNEFRYH